LPNRLSFAALIPVGAALAAVPYRPAPLPNGTYRYEMNVGAHAIGNSTIVVRRSGSTVEIAESATMAGAALVTERLIDEATFATSSYSVDWSGQHATLAIVGNGATLTQGKVTAKIAAALDAPFVVSDNMVAGFAQIPATLHVTGEKQLTLACVCGTFVAVPVEVVGQRDGHLSILVEGATARLTFDPRTYVLRRLELPSQQLSIVLQSYDAVVTKLPVPIKPTPVPLPPARYDARDVSIRASDGVVLAGTLTLPHGAATAPGFVFVHGSGCVDRDETVGPNKVFAQLANRLSNDGYAVLRYDKRGCGKSGGTFATRDRLIANARDAVAYLRAQPEIDGARVFVLGHSEGGEIAPRVAIADGRLRGIVLLAPPAIPLEKILMQQALRTAPVADRTTIAREEQAAIDAIAMGKKSGASNAWLRSSFGIDPATLIARVPCPILIVQGTKDIQVLAADTPRLVAAARAAKRKVVVQMLDGDDHLFIKLPADEPSSGGEYFTPSYLDRELFRAIESWLASLLWKGNADRAA
jgi:pimeloyl-ACP methyl ester carboxylesterase